MSHHFSMATVFRMTPYQVLGRFFIKVGLNLPLDWEKVVDMQPVQKAYQILPAEERERSESILKRITALACKEGYRALNEAAKLCDFPKWEITHRKTECNTFEIVFGLDTEEGTLELAAKANDVGQKMKGLLEETFIRTVYGIEPPPYAQPRFDIDMLKNERFSLATDPEDCVRAEISMFQILWDYHNRSTRLGVVPGDSIYDSVSCYESRKEVSRYKADFQRVKIRFFFGPKADRRAGMITVEIGPPGTCNITCHDPVKIEIVHKYLRRWGIELTQSEA